MRREELHELHCITPIANVASILSGGILSNRRARKIPHRSVAMKDIQERRKAKSVPGGRPLHEYVNLYFCARNPMMSRVRSHRKRLCVLRVAPNVLDLPDVVITDQNAASSYARFGAAPGALRIVDRDMVFARSWKHPDQITEWRHKSAKCAEVLVPDVVGSSYILGAYVSCSDSEAELANVAPELEVTVSPDLFFC